MRTRDEIEDTIKRLYDLKESLPEYNAFGESNWEPINAVVAIIDGVSTYHEFSNEPYEIESAAYQASEWMDSVEYYDLLEFI